MLKRFKYCTVLFVLAVMVITTAVSIYMAKLHEPGPLLYSKTLIIPKGASIKHVAESLYAESIIKSPAIFSTIHHLQQESITPKYGEYLFQPSISMFQVWDQISQGHTHSRKITIPEGWTVHQVREHLQANPYLEGDIPDMEEGTLLPETYHFTRGDSRASIMHQMHTSLRKNLTEAWEKRDQRIPIHTPEEALVLASIVERETSLPEERPRIAAVFINRIKRGMKLQADPTVAYALTGGRRPLERPLTRDDLNIDSPYNTYQHVSLPPKPIANPSLAAIEAVMHPAETEDLYFVVNPSGGHDFSTNYAEHQRFVSKYHSYIKQERKKLRGTP